ncbi:PLP-dependent aminotransferase family protein, partial [Bacillus subtilis]
PRKGWFAAEAEGDFAQTAPPPPPEKELEEHETAANMIDFHHGHVDLASFPVSQWKKTLAKTVGESGYDLFQSGPPAGDIPLRKMIAVYLRESRGVVCSPEQIIIGAGTPVLLQLLCHLFPKGTT